MVAVALEQAEAGVEVDLAFGPAPGEMGCCGECGAEDGEGYGVVDRFGEGDGAVVVGCGLVGETEDGVGGLVLVGCRKGCCYAAVAVAVAVLPAAVQRPQCNDYVPDGLLGVRHLKHLALPERGR